MDAGISLCISCHAEVGTAQKSASHHVIGKMARGCLTCHDPHFGPGPGNDKLLARAPAQKLCLGCHAKPMRRADGSAVPAVAETSGGASAHPPFARGECVKCHEPHGSDRANLLTEASTERLCAKCHDRARLVQDRASATAFRNGSRNLHALHLTGGHSLGDQASDQSGGGRSGRSCSTCHEAHASHQKSLIRATFVAYGQTVPISFEKSVEGGTCATVCHKAFTYRRSEEFKNASDR
jgi:predicted CXXCH cytochrome family protein